MEQCQHYIGYQKFGALNALNFQHQPQSNYLMSDKVVKRINRLKLYSGPLGKTISGNIANINKEHIRVYPASSNIVISMIRIAKVIKTLSDKQILEYLQEESIGAECSPKCSNYKCGQCALCTRQMLIKEKWEYQRAKYKMYLNTEGTEEIPGLTGELDIPGTRLEKNYRTTTKQF